MQTKCGLKLTLKCKKIKKMHARFCRNLTAYLRMILKYISCKFASFFISILTFDIYLHINIHIYLDSQINTLLYIHLHIFCLWQKENSHTSVRKTTLIVHKMPQNKQTPTRSVSKRDGEKNLHVKIHLLLQIASDSPFGTAACDQGVL